MRTINVNVIKLAENVKYVGNIHNNIFTFF